MNVNGQSDTDAEPRQENKVLRCAVCNSLSTGCHFRATACKACAAFFRRAVTKGRVYGCQQNGSCPIDWIGRTVCRSCRLNRCLAVGMLPEKVQKKDDKFGTTSSSRSACDSGVNLSEGSFTESDNKAKNKRKSKDSYRNRKRFNASTVERIMDGLDYYWEEQRRAFYRIHPERMGDRRHEFPQSTVTSHIKSQMALLGMTYDMMERYFDGYNELTKEQISRVNERNDMIFPPFEVAYNSSRFFPRVGDTRMLYSYDDMVDAAKMDEFFPEDKNPEESAKLYDTYRCMLLRFINKFKKLQVTKFEVAAMAGIVFWTEVKILYPIDIAYKMYDKITHELTTYCNNEYGATDFRFGKLLLLQRDAEQLGTVLKENYLISGFDNQHYDEYYRLSTQFYNIKIEDDDDGERRWSS